MIDTLSGYSTATGFLLQADNQDLLKAFDRVSPGATTMMAPSREAVSAKAAAQLAAFFISIAFWHQPDQPGRSDDVR